MMKIILKLLAFTVVTMPTTLFAQSSSFIAGSLADVSAIRAVVASQSANQEDPHVASDLDWENAFGIRYTNLKKRDDWFNATIKPQFKDATNSTLEVKVRFLEPTVAVADEYWHVVGQVYAGQTTPAADRWGRTTYIFKKEDGGWTEVMERVADLRSAYFKHYDALPAAVPIAPAILTSYAGKYQTAAGMPLGEVLVAGDRLTIKSHRGTFVAIPVSATEFLSFDPNDLAAYYKVSFTSALDPSGKDPKLNMTLSRPDGELLATASRVP